MESPPSKNNVFFQFMPESAISQCASALSFPIFEIRVSETFIKYVFSIKGVVITNYPPFVLYL